MVDASSRRLFEQFVGRTLPKSAWDHAAHLTVCWVALDSMDTADAVTFLRDAISSYNEATGVTNSTTEGYHDTITEYFVGAVASLAADDIDDVIGADRCHREAPLRHWSRARLFSPVARARWVDPDLAPLPWDEHRRAGRVNPASTGCPPPQPA